MEGLGASLELHLLLLLFFLLLLITYYTVEQHDALWAYAADVLIQML